jgi:hypothetical protein
MKEVLGAVANRESRITFSEAALGPLNLTDVKFLKDIVASVNPDNLNEENVKRLDKISEWLEYTVRINTTPGNIV